jgi:Na+-driven multidrug efflux pump
VVLSPALPALFSETGRVASLATYMLIIAGISMPMIAYSQSAYFTLRTGGKVLHTFLFDTVFMWGCVVPAAWILAYLTDAPIETIYAVCVLLEILKSLIGALLVRYVKWANHLVGEPSDAA